MRIGSSAMRTSTTAMIGRRRRMCASCRSRHPHVARRHHAWVVIEHACPSARDTGPVGAPGALSDAAADRDDVWLPVARGGYGTARAVERETALLVRGADRERAARIARGAD